MAMSMELLNPVDHYFSDIARFSHLSDAEVQQLSTSIAAAQHQQDPQREAQARQQLIEGLLSEVLPTAQRYAPHMHHLTLLDLIQEGNYGLVLAAHRYPFHDTSRSFGSYALTYIRGMIKRDLHEDAGIFMPSATFYAHRAKGRLDPLMTLLPISLDAVHYEGDDESRLQDRLAASPCSLSSHPDVTEDVQHKRAQVEMLLAMLPTREQHVLRLRYGLDEQDGRTLDRDDVARELGLSVAQVARMETHALQQLRDYTGTPSASNASPRMRQYHQRRRQEQQARLQEAHTQLLATGIPITRTALQAVAHTDNKAAAAFLRHQFPKNEEGEWSMKTQERLQKAYRQLLERGECLSVPRLKAVAHVGTNTARHFLRNQGVPPQKGGRRKLFAVQ